MDEAPWDVWKDRKNLSYARTLVAEGQLVVVGDVILRVVWWWKSGRQWMGGWIIVTEDGRSTASGVDIGFSGCR